MTDWMALPILLYGPRKSGTTLLQSLLDGGPDLLMVPGELKLKFLDWIDWLPQRERAGFYISQGRSFFKQNALTWRNRRLISTSSLRVGSLAPKEVSKVLDVADYPQYFEEAMRNDSDRLKDFLTSDVLSLKRALRPHHRYLTWEAKEVDGSPRSVLSRFKEMFPGARCVLITREPRFVVRSIVLERRRKGVRLSHIAIAIESWKAFRIVSTLRGAPQSEFTTTTTYEDLVRQTGAETSRIASSLRLPFHESYTTPTTLGVSAKVATSSRHTTSVFDGSTRDWKDGLCLFERFTIRASFALLARGASRMHDQPYKPEQSQAPTADD